MEGTENTSGCLGGERGAWKKVPGKRRSGKAEALQKEED